MKLPKNYHSAHGNENNNLKDINYYENNGCVTLKHDLNNEIPKIFKKCDCIYSEPAWRTGYKLFKKRANVKNFEYKDYMNSIQKVINELNVPTFIIGGKHMLKYLKPNHILNIKFNGVFYAMLLQWNTELIEVNDNLEIIDYLSNKYNTVLDFSCGYGQHLLKFNNFIASDFNGKCIYQVAKSIGYED